MTNNLRTPLRRRGLNERIKGLIPSALQAATGLSVMAAGGLALWLYVTPPPVGFEQVVSVDIPPPAENITTATTKAVEPSDEGEAANDLEMPDPGTGQSITGLPPMVRDPDLPTDGNRGGKKRQAVILGASRVSLIAAPVMAVTQRSKSGPLPKVAKNGSKPFDVYARPVDATVLASNQPKIAILIGGMGINSQLSKQAIGILPGEVTFAFAPYGNDTQRLVNSARHSGHEILLQLPMEPFGYPAVDPGPHTLLTNADPRQNLNDLHWQLSRFTGYVGVLNYLGAKFTSDGGALMPIMSDISKRGLVYLDDGSSENSMVGEIGHATELPTRVAHRVIDEASNEKAILAALDNLEETARQQGIVIGVGTGSQATIEAVGSWVQDARRRGVIFVPISAAYRPRKS